MQSKIRTHDGIVGATYMLSVILAAATSIQWLWVAGVVAGLQIISPVTKFCPVYFVLNKMMPDTDPIQNGQRN
ncbi:MAG: YgaP family membrane protein [Acidimicrobiales bacterium]